ncbi:hypothetical protein M2135_001767 [Parabacteroides sp. PF5-9]|nr:hypothetical protein [Parabacteroides sp. PF5-9]
MRTNHKNELTGTVILLVAWWFLTPGESSHQ